jgi:exodeoxyribonuclease V beta subunit
VRGYDYERHFGGVYYGFLRALRAGRTSGWYFDRPALRLVGALDALVTGGGGA